MRALLKRLIERAQNTVPFRVLTAFGESHAGNYATQLVAKEK